MNNKQLAALNVALGDYPHEVVTMKDIPYHVIKCRREKIPAETCLLLMSAPDFDGIMTWNRINSSLCQITFTYKATD